MDYEKAYKESIERAKNYISGHHTDVDPRSAMECVFPELRESEDENIRQDIIDWLINYKDNVQVDLKDEEVDRWVSWLEKQGEQKVINEYNEHEPTSYEIEKWNGAYEKGYDIGYMNGKNEQKPTDAIAEMNPTWSEDDEKKMNKLVSLCTNFKNSNTQLYSVYLEFQELIDWLKSIRHRHITYELDAPLGYDKDMNPIYPPINHWRPSPEQMRAVFDASERNDKLGSVLRNLYDDLRKL